MKRSICWILTVLLTLSAFSISASAENGVKMVPVTETTEYLSDGSYIRISVWEEPVLSRAGSYQKNGSKSYVLHNASGEPQWEFTLKGIFTVDPGVSSVCTSATYSYDIYNTNWIYNRATSYYTGNQAIGEAEFIRKLLGITVERETCTLTLTCDKNGNLS